jgi:hypothetical protein
MSIAFWCLLAVVLAPCFLSLAACWWPWPCAGGSYACQAWRLDAQRASFTSNPVGCCDLLLHIQQ